ncbi:nitric oxide-sensing protein NosP [Salinispirillum marinum]|uniref:Nitric oxide-sensing protein NosP n=2 Tax=Saccharospirillaceae TaxID=255527 RepID=A0ABV8BES8_9GAMM
MSNPTIAIYPAWSDAIDPVTVAQSLADQYSGTPVTTVLFFCSAEYPLAELAEALNNSLAHVPLIGCTTAGEINPQGYARGSVSAIGFDPAYVTLSSALIEDLPAFGFADAQRLLDELLMKAPALCGNEVFAMTLLDGLSSQEERVLAALDAVLGSIPHFGGSAGDDIHLARTHVFINGRFHTQAAILILFHTKLPFAVFSTHHMAPLHEKLVVTAADPDTRTVHELNAQPAAQAYLEAFGIDRADLNPTTFALHPLAVRTGNAYYVRSIQRVNADDSLTFYCAVGNGMVLTTMTPEPLLPNLATCLTALETRIGPPLLTLGCDCFLRRTETESRGDVEAASDFLRQHRVLGFNTYGEHFDGVHINQTFTGVMLGYPKDGPDEVHQRD